ncbi:MAG: response regulator [Tepidiphilus sp.]|jgi:two-component system response regulator PilR (NtrC family)|uniref:response regulator n=1 Tax=Tepidiphilus sp. J10 TaxID=2502185 RepID=UPI00115F0483|nr:response regulator [Tepidiphilus sp. J10]MDD2408969.1 response regulator [Tepidiphilus sp.]MDD3434156.1 response regulator [Tepidiphilus sp.]
MPRALIIDDEPDLRTLLTLALRRHGWQADSVGDCAGARKVLADTATPYHLILTDLRLPDGNGLELVPYARERRPLTPVVVLTAYGDIDTAVHAVKLGAHDFLTKPLRAERLAQILDGFQHCPPDRDAPLDAAALVAVLERNRWNQSKTARELGWTLAKLRYWMQRLGLAE